MNKLIQSLRSELDSSRRQIAELATKDKKAVDAIQALERKIDQMKLEISQLQQINGSLNKELKTSQVRFQNCFSKASSLG